MITLANLLKHNGKTYFVVQNGYLRRVKVDPSSMFANKTPKSNVIMGMGLSTIEIEMYSLHLVVYVTMRVNIRNGHRKDLIKASKLCNLVQQLAGTKVSLHVTIWHKINGNWRIKNTLNGLGYNQYKDKVGT